MTSQSHVRASQASMSPPPALSSSRWGLLSLVLAPRGAGGPVGKKLVELSPSEEGDAAPLGEVVETCSVGGDVGTS